MNSFIDHNYKFEKEKKIVFLFIETNKQIIVVYIRLIRDISEGEREKENDY